MSDKSSPENEYFARVEQEKKDRLAKQLAEADAAEEAARLKALHWNRCGRCGQPMSPKPFKGIEIDVCSACGSVLLDPGELQKVAGEDQSGVVTMIADLFGFKKTS